MKEKLALGIDLGGSKIFAVITDEENNVLAEAKLPTDPALDPEGIANAMRDTALLAAEQLSVNFGNISFFGAAVPSPVDPVTGDCLFATNLNWKKASMKTLLNKIFKKDFKLGNDGNLGMLGEHFCGAAKGFHTTVGYFIGTGLGGGIIVNDRLLLGRSGLAAELGHTIISLGGRRCGCGHKGCVEAYCSKKAFVKALRKQIFKLGSRTALPEDKFDEKSTNIKSKHLAKAYFAGDPVVCNVINKGLRVLGASIASTCAVIDPGCVVIGGGFAEAMGEEIIPVIRESFSKHLFGIDPETVEIRLASLGDRSVAVGATLLARGY